MIRPVIIRHIPIPKLKILRFQGYAESAGYQESSQHSISKGLFKIIKRQQILLYIRKNIRFSYATLVAGQLNRAGQPALKKPFDLLLSNSTVMVNAVSQQ